MATLALSVAGQFAGGALGGPIGATIGRAVGALAGSVIDNALFAPPNQSVEPSADLKLLGSSEGGGIPRVYGWARLTGNIIWATELERASETDTGGKGSGASTGTDETQYLATFAVGLCEGEVSHVGRIWADGRLLESDGLDFSVHKGSQDQGADDLIEQKQGSGNAPAYRDLCYLVFNGLPLAQFGNRIPVISVEVCRVVGDLEPAIKAITLIPGSTEYGYDPTPRVRVLGPGRTSAENTHLLGQTSDWDISLSQLTDLCPNLENVALVVAWFGDDLRADHCRVQPRSEGSTRNIADATWMVSGKTRSEVPEVSTYQGGPAFGGTPSDAAVKAAVADLKARGLKVTLYPFMMMDIAHGNSKIDPYSGTSGQPAYPWRGRITCDPAPGETGSPDKSAAATSQVSAFLGNAEPNQFTANGETISFSGGDDWGYRRMVLHYAYLAIAAGGVDAFLIGSELVGLTTIRSGTSTFPFVDGLVDLAADVRAILGAGTKLTYGADWSEYSGLQPADAPGDKLFHLDPLWASSDVDAIGIDNYMPLADWRGRDTGLDIELSGAPYDRGYLAGNIAGGEGYDWYYASEADRDAQIRTLIADGAHGEDWIWRYKDLVNWWSNDHHNRVNGVRDTNATGWVPASKPVWLTELGCPAIDKGANQPNVFGDPKSSEDARPYFSSGTEDRLIQRQFLRAHLSYWPSGGELFSAQLNPWSSIYGGRMLDTDRIYLWTWDARPFPAFPQQADVWADASNHAIGHWLTGRLGGLAIDELISAMSRDWGVEISVDQVEGPFIDGLTSSRPATLRAASEVALSISGMNWRDEPDGLHLIASVQGNATEIDKDRVAKTQDVAFKHTRSNPEELPGQFELGFADRMGDYRASLATASDGRSARVETLSGNLVLNDHAARMAAETLLAAGRRREQVEFVLPLSGSDVEVGDVFDFGNERATRFRIETLRRDKALRVAAHQVPDHSGISAQSHGPSRTALTPAVSAQPEIVLAHLPSSDGDTAPSRLLFAAYSDPWPGTIRLIDAHSGDEFAKLDQIAAMGVLASDLPTRTSRFWDRTSKIDVTMWQGHLSSVTEAEALNGANKLAVEHDDGNWEILSFANAELVSGQTYRLSNLLRGRDSTHHALFSASAQGNRVVLLDGAEHFAALPPARLDAQMSFDAQAPAGLLPLNVSIVPQSELARPAAPVHLDARHVNGSLNVRFSWIRRSRNQGESWSGADVPLDFAPEKYRLALFDGATKVREVELTEPEYVYAAADLLAEYGTTDPLITYTICQLSRVLGSGLTATGTYQHA